MTEPRPVTYPVPVVQDQVSEDTALMLSLGGSIVPWAMVIAGAESGNDGLVTAGALGTLFGPSFGHWYAHDVFTAGLGMRVAGVGTAIVGVMSLVREDCDYEDTCDEGEGGAVLLLVGSMLYIGGTLHDVATAPGKARKYNRSKMMIVPTANPHGGGFAIAGSF